MRVIYFSRDYTPHDHRFLSALADTEHDVSYLRLENRGRLLETRPVPTGIHAIDWWGGRRSIGPADWPRAAWESRRIINKLQPDLIHAGPIQSAAFLAALAGFHPLLTMSWGSDILREASEGMGRLVASWTLDRTDVFTCDCQAVRQRAIELGAPAANSFVFPWGVDLDHFSPGGGHTSRRAFGWLANEIVLLSTRSWEPLYGVRELAQAFIEVASEEPQLRLLMLGSGSLEEELRQMFEQGGLASRVVMPGQIRNQDLPAYYRAADMYVSASYSDGSSISLLEAMACGLPVIVSDIPGNREWVEPGVNGFWFKSGDAVDLAATIRRGLTERAGFDSMGHQSRQLAEKRADWPKNFAVLMEAYQAARQAEVIAG